MLARLVVRERILAHDYRVVHDDAERHDESEEAHHVDASADEVEHAEGGHERDRYPHRHPEGDAAVQEQKQHGHDEHEAAGAVLQKQQDAFPDELPGLVVDLDLHPGRPTAGVLGEPRLDDLGGPEAARILVAIEAHLDGRPAPVGHARLAAARAALDGGHVAEGHQTTGCVGEQGQALEIDLATALLQGAELAGDVVEADAARGKIAAHASHALGDLVEREVQLVQGRGGHLDGDLLLGQPYQLDLGDAALEQLALHLLHERTELAQIRARDHQPRHRLVAHDARDLGLLRRLGQIAHEPDALLDLIEGHTHIRAFLVLEDDAGAALRGGRRHLAQLIERVQLLLEGLGDRALHVLGGRAGPFHAHADEVEREVRKELGVESAQAPDTSQDHDGHEQIARHLVLREDAQEVVAVSERHGAAAWKAYRILDTRPR